jgi:hypothetical protein
VAQPVLKPFSISIQKSGAHLKSASSACANPGFLARISSLAFSANQQSFRSPMSKEDTGSVKYPSVSGACGKSGTYSGIHPAQLLKKAVSAVCIRPKAWAEFWHHPGVYAVSSAGFSVDSSVACPSRNAYAFSFEGKGMYCRSISQFVSALFLIIFLDSPLLISALCDLI